MTNVNLFYVLIKQIRLKGKLIKTVLGLFKFCHATPLMKALSVKPIS